MVYLDHGVEFVFQLHGLVVVHVAVAVEQVPLQILPRSLLSSPGRFSRFLVEVVAVVPGGTVGLPRSKAHPAKVVLARQVLANHVVAATVLLDDGLALGTLLGVGRNPIASLGVIVALFDPQLDEFASHRVVPVLQAGETEHVATSTLDGLRLQGGGLDSIVTVGGRTPLQ